MADRKPGPQDPSSNPQNIRDGTNSLQPAPKPSTSGFWQGVESAADGVYEVLSKRLLTLANQGLSAVDLQRSLFAKYGDQASAEAEKYFGYVTDQIKNAADWDSLNKLAGPVLGQQSFQAGVVVGVGESLVGDAAGLLGLLKMLVLAGIYQRTQSPSTLIVDPMSAVMLLAVKCIPSFAEQTKVADEQLQKMVKELFEIARHPLDFIEAVGKNAWKGGMDDLEQLKFYAHQNTLMSQFEAGRIVGRVLYQVIMAILMVVGAAGAVAKLASKFPELLRIAGIIGKGGELGDMVEVTKAGGGAANVVEKGPEFVKVEDFGKTKTAAPEPETPLAQGGPPPAQPSAAEKAASDLKKIYEKAPAAKNEIDALSQQVADQFGGKVAKAPLKSEQRAMEKIMKDYGGDASRIKDLARNTIVVPAGSEQDALAALLKANPEINPRTVKIVNAATDELGYSGINVTVPTKAGIPAEIQINSPEMIYAKESSTNARAILGDDLYNQIASRTDLPPGGMGHQLYEQWRQLPPGSPDASKIAEESKAYYQAFRR